MPRRANDSGTGQAGITPQKIPHSSLGGLASPGINNQLDQAIEEHFLEKKLPGLVVLYSRDGLLVYKKTLGFADVESQTKVNESHIFRFASVSKLIAAAVALKAVEQGQLNLNAKVKSLLPEIPDHHTYTSETPCATETNRDALPGSTSRSSNISSQLQTTSS